MTIEIYKDPESFGELRKDWVRLARRHSNPLFDYLWYEACISSLYESRPLYVVAHFDRSGSIDAIAPLVQETHQGSSVLHAIGASTLFEPVGFPHRSAQSLAGLFRELTSLRLPVFVNRLWSATTDPVPSNNLIRSRGLWLRRRASGSSVQVVPNDWDMYFASLSTGFRAEIRRKTNKGKRTGQMRFVALTPNRFNLSEVLEIAANVEDRSWKGRNGTSLKRNEKLYNFVKTYCLSICTDQSLRLFLLYLDDRPIAMAIKVLHSNRLWELKIGFDEEYGNLSPGMLLSLYVTQYCVDNGIGWIEHLGAFAQWQHRWSDEIRPYSSYSFYPMNYRGIAAISDRAFGRLLKPLQPRKEPKSRRGHSVS